MSTLLRTKEDLLLELREKGLRLTPQREKIIDIFYALPTGEHLSAEELYGILKKESTDISLATSYRTLKLLASVGVLREVDFTEDTKQYELARDGDEPHHHLICVTCGATEEFESQLALEEAKQVAAKFGFGVVDVQIKLLAKCLPNKTDCPLKMDKDI